MWPKRVGDLYNKYKNIVQLVDSEICVYWTVACRRYNIKKYWEEIFVLVQ